MIYKCLQLAALCSVWDVQLKNDPGIAVEMHLHWICPFLEQQGNLLGVMVLTMPVTL